MNSWCRRFLCWSWSRCRCWCCCRRQNTFCSIQFYNNQIEEKPKRREKKKLFPFTIFVRTHFSMSRRIRINIFNEIWPNFIFGCFHFGCAFSFFTIRTSKHRSPKASNHSIYVSTKISFYVRIQLKWSVQCIFVYMHNILLLKIEIKRFKLKRNEQKHVT